jgi:hypothetical protein
MPTPPEHRNVLHYFGYFYPILFIAFGLAGLIGSVVVLVAVSGLPKDKFFEGLLIGAGIALFGVGLTVWGGFTAWRHRQADDTAPMTLDDYPLEEQPRQLRRYMWLTVVATAFTSAVVAYPLMQLESGAAASVRVWFAIADIYESFGFWPAVLFVPALGLLGLLALGWKLRSASQRLQKTIRTQ